MSRQARFEIVRTDAGHFARFIASNGREVWRTSETYTRRKAAVRAVELIVGDATYISRHAEHPEIHWQGSPDLAPTEVIDVDERGQ